jgi:hypothetical protein
MYPNWDFWYENKPSGNPAWNSAASVGSSGKSNFIERLKLL